MDEKDMEAMWQVMRQHNLQCADDTSSEYECVICNKILTNACSAPCRCLFCLDCIEEYLKDGKRKCPGQTECCDLEDIGFNDDIQINRVINKRVSRIRVKCPNFGCSSTVELSVIADHLRKCDDKPEDCPYSALGCERDKLRNNQMRDHLSMEILSHSRLLINWIEQTGSSKRDIDELRSEVEKLRHDNEELKAQTKIDKEFSENVIRELLRKEKENQTEIAILNDEMCALKNSNRSIRQQMKMLEESVKLEITEFVAKNENQFKKAEEDQQRLEPSDEILLQPERSDAVIDNRLIEELQIKVDKTSRVCDALITETTETAKSVANIRATISQEFHWTINRWAERLDNALNGKQTKIFSDSFFTGEKGFKFCLSLSPNSGDLWIYFHIERGPFDDLLRWPFDRHLELSLINSQTGLAKKTMTEKCSRSHPRMSRLQKPKTERNEPILIFNISLQELSSKPELIKNDQMLIKLSVKPAIIDIKTK